MSAGPGRMSVRPRSGPTRRLRRATRTPSSIGPEHRRRQQLDRPTNAATNSFAGAAYRSSGVPTCSSRPARSTATRSPRSNASSCSWVTSTVVMPTRWISSRISRRVRSRSAGSRLDSGSSRSSTRGSGASARASATRCCWPPESWLMRRRSKPARSTRVSARVTRRSSSSPPRPERLEAEGDVLAHVEVGEERVVLEHHPEPPGDRVRCGHILAFDERPGRRPVTRSPPAGGAWWSFRFRWARAARASPPARARGRAPSTATVPSNRFASPSSRRKRTHRSAVLLPRPTHVLVPVAHPGCALASERASSPWSLRSSRARPRSPTPAHCRQAGRCGREAGRPRVRPGAAPPRRRRSR